VVDGALARQGMGRRVRAAVPYFLPALAAGANTDAIGTVPARLPGARAVWHRPAPARTGGRRAAVSPWSR
jgi:hypothetical protein